MATAANPMCVDGTPVEHHPDLGLWVKREDLCCPGGPNFSKTRGVYAHVKSRPEPVIGVLDTDHSQGGWAVARACEALGKQCINYYPVRKAARDNSIGWDPTGKGQWGDVLKPQQAASQELGSSLIPLQAGRSAVLYHQAKKDLHDQADPGSYMMPNALKLPEMISETVAEVRRTALPDVGTVLISASSGTIAAGVIIGLCLAGYDGSIIVHQGYSRSEAAMRNYMDRMAAGYSNELHFADRHPGGRLWTQGFVIIDEIYQYADTAIPAGLPPFPCNSHYDLKALSWWLRIGRDRHKEALLWNIG